MRQQTKAHIRIEQHTPLGVAITTQDWELAALTIIVSAAEELAEVPSTTRTRRRKITHEHITTRQTTTTTEERHIEDQEETRGPTRQLERPEARLLQ